MSQPQFLWSYVRHAAVCVFVFCAGLSWLQAAPGQPAWQTLDRLPEGRPAAEVWIRAERFHAVALDHAAMRAILGRAPHEQVQPLGTSSDEITLPMPDGSLARFRFVESPVMAPELAAKFPEIKTYRGEGIDDPAATVRFDLTPAGFHAQILSPRGAVYIDPAFRRGNKLHTSYYKRDYRRSTDFQCYTPSGQTVNLQSRLSADLARSGSNLRTYRLAVAATGEYTQFHGGTVANGMAAIVTAINRVTGVYEADLAIRLVLVANNDLLVYTSPNSDPYSNNNASSLLGQNQANLDAVIGSANYDIGHVFSTAGGGLSALGVVCRSGSKAQSETGTGAPIGDAFYIDYVAHEMGHQFGANHTFNSSMSSCGGGNRNGSTAYEPGSGSTIMAYAGICTSDDLQPHSDPYFHSISFDEILDYSTAGSGNNCAVLTSTGNNEPTVSAGTNYVIPQNTPFTLTATGSDPDGDALTYCWEERDLGPSTTVTAPDNGSSPLFRSWNPTPDPSRTFPRLQDLLNNTLAVGEVMPTTTRTMNFRVTARDNRSGGGVSTADMQVSVVSSAGPFTVTFPNSAGTLSGTRTITWDVAGTTAAPINAANVNILLSTDGGQTFPITLVANTPNDGSQIVVLPNLNTTAARIKVEAAGNIFFDLSDANFTIVPAIPTPSVTLESATIAAENCSTTNNAIDPGETVTVNFVLKNIGTANTTNLVATLLTTNGVMSPGTAQNYGVLIAGGASVSRSFSYVALGGCGGTLTAVLQLQDGPANLGTVSQTFTLGAVTATATARTNASAMTIPATGTKGPASPYPSTISVSGLTGVVGKVTVTLAGLSHARPADVDILLVGPTGQTLLLMSDTGDANAVSGVTLTFDDSAAAALPNAAQIVSGTFKPTNYDTSSDTLSLPAPGGPYGQALSVFNNLDPNGTWQLYVDDDFPQQTGSIAQGWSLTITTFDTNCCGGTVSAADVALGESAFPAALNVGGNVIYTLNVTNLGPDTANSVTVTDTIPAGLSFVSADSTLGTPANNGGIVTCALGSMTNGARATITIQTTATTPGSKTNVVSAASSTLDPVSANNTASATVSVNAIPTIDGLTNAATFENTSLGPLVFAISDEETPASSLTLTRTCSDTNLIPLANIVFGGNGNDRTLSVLPSLNQSGSAIITVTVSDGFADTSDSFVVTVVPWPRITAIEVSNNVVNVTWAAMAGQVYRLQYLTNLNVTNWSDVPPDVTAGGPSASQIDPSAVDAQRFYRVMLVP